MGTAHIYRLSDLLEAARAKYGIVAGMAAHSQAKAQQAQQRKQSKQEAAAERREALEQAAGVMLKYAALGWAGLH
jgi:ribosomal protein L12E/L44/L45/RPP1/RPP2